MDDLGPAQNNRRVREASPEPIHDDIAGVVRRLFDNSGKLFDPFEEFFFRSVHIPLGRIIPEFKLRSLAAIVKDAVKEICAIDAGMFAALIMMERRSEPRQGFVDNGLPFFSDFFVSHFIFRPPIRS
jgi:hypothetical protein